MRFSSPFDKLERVHREILAKYTIIPKFNSKNFWKYDFFEKNWMFTYIWNESLNNIDKTASENYNLNLYLAFEEVKEFSASVFFKNIIQAGIINFCEPEKFIQEDFDFSQKQNLEKIETFFKRSGLINIEIFNNLKGFETVEKLFIAYRMNFPINIYKFLKISENKKNLTPEIKRLLWLYKTINNYDLCINNTNLKAKLEDIYLQAKSYRRQTSILKPLELLILAEGATEEILLPEFSKLAGIDFNKNGIKIISSGGKNQILKLYTKFSKETALPIMLIFDSDGKEEAKIIQKHIRARDHIYIIKNGEFEDILPDSLICKAVNLNYRLTGKINLCEIEGTEKKSHVLRHLWKDKGFGEFKKAEFARIIANYINKKTSISEELNNIFSIIIKLVNK